MSQGNESPKKKESGTVPNTSGTVSKPVKDNSNYVNLISYSIESLFRIRLQPKAHEMLRLFLFHLPLFPDAQIYNNDVFFFFSSYSNSKNIF